MNMYTITCAHTHKSIGKRERERERKNQERNRDENTIEVGNILLNTTIISGHENQLKTILRASILMLTLLDNLVPYYYYWYQNQFERERERERKCVHYP